MGRTFRASAQTAVLILCIAALSCRSQTRNPPTPAPTAPSAPPVNIAGTWVGTLESANFAARSIKMVVVQTANCVDGAWETSPSEWTGAISGIAATDSYTGQFSLEGPSANGSRCSAVANVSGPVADGMLRWTGDGLKAIGDCSGELPTAIVIALQRQ